MQRIAVIEDAAEALFMAVSMEHTTHFISLL